MTALAVPAAVRFLSCEPLIESVRLGHAVGFPPVPGPKPDWVIIGGESGGKARPFDVEWARDLVDQCRALGAAPFVKQLGANIRTRNDDSLLCDYSEGGWFLNADWQVEDNVNGFREEHQGAEVRIRLNDGHGGDPEEWPEDLRVREFPEVHR